MKVVIGWLRLKQGMREELLTRIRPFVVMTRTEPGVIFFEVNLSDDDADVAVFVECYDSEEAHQTHQATPEHRALLGDIGRIGISGRFEHFYPPDRAVSEFGFAG